MANEKIYVVTKGIYSDYHVITATTDHELAKKIAARFDEDYDETRVIEFSDAELMLRPAWIVHFDKAGIVIETEECRDEYDYYDLGKCYERQWDNCTLDITVSADDLESAIKIAAEKRAKYLAEKLGL